MVIDGTSNAASKTLASFDSGVENGDAPPLPTTKIPSMKAGRLRRSLDDAIFEEVTRFLLALEARLKPIEVHASTMAKRDKNVSSCPLDFGLGGDALANIDDEVNRVPE